MIQLSTQSWLFIIRTSAYNEIKAVHDTRRSFLANGFVQPYVGGLVKPSLNEFTLNDKALLDKLRDHKPIERNVNLSGLFARLCQQYRLNFALQDELDALFFDSPPERY